MEWVVDGVTMRGSHEKSSRTQVARRIRDLEAKVNDFEYDTHEWIKAYKDGRTVHCGEIVFVLDTSHSFYGKVEDDLEYIGHMTFENFIEYLYTRYPKIKKS